MLTKHPLNAKANLGNDELETTITKNNKSTNTYAKSNSEEEKAAIATERVKAAAKLEGVSTERLLVINNIANNTNVTTNLSRNNADRLSKESGIGSSVGSSFDEKDDEIDHSSQSTTNTSVSTENTKISPRVSQLLDDLDDTMTKLANDNKKSLGIITEEEESYNNHLRNNISRLNHSHNHHNNNSFNKKQHQNRITFSDNLDSNSNSEITESSTFNDTESSTSGGTNNEPDSPSLLNNVSISNNNSTNELEKKKNSFKRKNSGRSIFSVLSSSSLRASSSSSRNSQGGSLSDPEDGSPNSNRRHNQRVTMPGSPSKSDRILSRSGFSSLSIRRRRSKPTLSDIKLNSNSNNNMISSELSTSRSESPENFENLSKAGKVLGLTVSEDKILLDKSSNKIIKKAHTIASFSSDERILSLTSTKSSNGVTSNSSKTNNILGYDDNRQILNKSSKANKILGLDDSESNKRSPSMYVDRVAKLNLSGGVGGNGGIRGPITVASIMKNIIYKGFLTKKYTNTNFVLKSWKRRYFILAKNTLYCFKSSDNASQLLDQFELTADSVVCVCDNFNGRSWVLQVGKSNQKPWYIQADTVEDMKVWLTELKSIVVKCNNTPEIPPAPLNSIDKLLLDDDDEDDDYDNIDDLLNDGSHKMHQRAFSSPTKLVGSSKLSMAKSSSSIDDNSVETPYPSMMTSLLNHSLPPPPRPRSAPSSPSSPPSPTSLSPPPRPMYPHHHVPDDVEKLYNDDLEIPSRPSSPVETLSPPRARFGNSIQSHQHQGSTSSTYSTSSITPPSRSRRRSNSANSALSINTSSIQRSTSPRQSPLSPPVINNSPVKSTRNSSLSHRESIPIMMPSWGVRTASPTTTSNPFDNCTSLPPPPRSPPRPPSRSDQQIPYANLPIPPRPPEGPKPPARNNIRINPDRHLTRSPPPNIPLPQPPPRPKNTLTSSSRATSPIPSRMNNNQIIPPSTSSHLTPLPIPPLRKPSNVRMGGGGTVTNLPVSTQNVNPAASSLQGRSSLHERTMTLPTNLPSCLPSYTKLPARSKSPPPSRRNITSMVHPSNPSRFQTMSLHLPSYVTIPLPPPTRPPNVPLPPVPNQSLSPFSSSISSSTSTIKPYSATKDITNNKLSPPTQPSIEFPDDDDLDPDYADELAASRIRIKSTNNLLSSGTTYFPMISDDDFSSDNYHQQLSASGLTFVMVEETLGDGELVLDIQDVSENHPHIIRSKSSYSNIHNDLIRNDSFVNTTISEEEKNLERKEKKNEKEKEMVKSDLNSGENEMNDTINESIINEKVEIANGNNISNVLISTSSI